MYVRVSVREKTAVLSQQGRFWQSADRPLFTNTLLTRVEVSFRGSQPSSHKNSENENTNFESSIIFVVPISQTAPQSQTLLDWIAMQR